MPAVRWEGFGGLGIKGEGTKKYKLTVVSSQGNIKNSIRNMDNNIIMTIYGIRWVLGLSEQSLCRLYKCLTTMLYT